MVAGVSRPAIMNLIRESPALIFSSSHASDELPDVFVHVRGDFLNPFDQPVALDHALQIFANRFLTRQRDQRIHRIAQEIRWRRGVVARRLIRRRLDVHQLSRDRQIRAAL